MTLDQFKKAIQDKSIPDRQVLKMYLDFRPTSDDDIIESVNLLIAHRPTVVDKLTREPE